MISGTPPVEATGGALSALSGASLDVSAGDGVTITAGIPPVDAPLELDGGAGRTTSADEDEDTTGTGRFPVPTGASLVSGTAVTMTSTVEVNVLVGSTSLLLTTASEEEDEEESGLVPNSDSTNEVKSGN